MSKRLVLNALKMDANIASTGDVAKLLGLSIHTVLHWPAELNDHHLFTVRAVAVANGYDRTVALCTELLQTVTK
jgi:hypothetical protein